MTILAVETSAVTCSVACYDGTAVTERFVNNGLNHSRTLMPLLDEVLREAGLTAGEVDAFLCTNGPGSFTGVRIGVSAVKGMAAATGKPCAGLSTLLCTAASAPAGTKGVVCCLMDARRGQFYNALFSLEEGGIRRLTEDSADAGESITQRIRELACPVTLMGDGASVFLPFAEGLEVVLPEGDLVYQKASGLIAAALQGQVDYGPSSQLLPGYLRKPQAEREREERQNRQGAEKKA